MCGIAGFWSNRSLLPDEMRARMVAMRDAIEHRGPDDAGIWVHDALAFGHRRLSIVDLSPLGHQPMTSPDGRFTICFNGEVFNFIALRDELGKLGHAFRGGSDTEVMLAAIAQWGVVAAVQRFVGMFAFSLWDERDRALYLVRDRVGIKPLYVGRTSAGDLLFGSELKALMAYPGFERKINPDAAAAYVRYAYVPGPDSIFVDAIKLLPGHVMRFTRPTDELDQQPFWSLEDVAREGRASRFTGDWQEAEDSLDALLRDAVALRMIADVPLGAFLSGGIDSSLVVSMMQAQSSRPVKTFTIGFAEARYDESSYARAIANHLGTEHTEQRVTPKEALDVIPQLPSMYDEPLADSSQIPTYLVSALARKHVTVALSGDGGDELFGGYERYRFAPRAWNWVRRVPSPVRGPAAGVLRGLAGAGLGTLVGSETRVRKSADLLDTEGVDSLYRRLVSTTDDPLSLMTLEREPVGALARLLCSQAAESPVERMMLADTMVYLPDDLLTKLDRASMAVALEGRVPILDHRVAGFAWTLPLEKRTGKALLRRVLGRYVPTALYERPKMGFEVPIGGWLRGALRPWAEDLLNPRSLADGGVFAPTAIREITHRARRRASGLGAPALEYSHVRGVATGVGRNPLTPLFATAR